MKSLKLIGLHVLELIGMARLIRHGRKHNTTSNEVAVAGSIGLAGAVGQVVIPLAPQTDPPPPPVGGWHEPAGMKQVLVNTFDESLPAGWGTNPVSSTPKIIQDSTAPISPPNVGRVTYRAGYAGGTSPVVLQYNFTAPQYTKVYVRYHAKYSSNWQAQKAGTNKQFYVWAKDSPTTFMNAYCPSGIGTGDMKPCFCVQGVPHQTLTRRSDGTYDTSAIFRPDQNITTFVTRGVWHTWEVVMEMNTGNNEDGKVSWWLDGKLLRTITNLRYTSIGDKQYFWKFDFTPVWGGVGDNVVNEQYLDVDHVYVSGGYI